MTTWHNVYITDCTGKKFFNTQASPMSTMSEIKNLTRHIDAIKSGSSQYGFIDKESAQLMLDDVPYGAQVSDEIDIDTLLDELLSQSLLILP